ncbi:hypothetical protein LSS_21360 [Leptospira santarosai serovar Shermani str. LT 821]|uniref:Uncharacterized protein n=1 Tax=Leptospira santarosai serovar Shermani str. LT 821 TaxID=758847 RepID=A0A097ESF2_9LEPT|nr:hypothetical protein LSS_21360 [Leptospira santarosai serovar Shermani str. LT 821]
MKTGGYIGVYVFKNCEIENQKKLNNTSKTTFHSSS